MPVLIVILIFASFFAYFATQNTLGITIQIFQYTMSDVPLYLVVLGAMLGGVCASWFISVVGSISSTWTLRGKDQALKQTKLTVGELTKKIHQLELQNTELKAKTGDMSSADDDSL